jgi:hypothetical protein
MAGDKDSGRSTTGYVFTVGGTPISWILKLQKVVALSKIETEYVVTIEDSKEIIWLQRFMEELGNNKENSILYCDNKSSIYLANNSSFHSNTNHIQLKYHFIQSILEYGHLLAQGQICGSTLKQRTNKTLTAGRFGNTCEADEVSHEVEAGVVVGLRCLQP